MVSASTTGGKIFPRRAKLKGHVTLCPKIYAYFEYLKYKSEAWHRLSLVVPHNFLCSVTSKAHFGIERRAAESQLCKTI